MQHLLALAVFVALALPAMADGKVGEFLGHGVHQSIYKIEPGDRSGISKVQVFVDDQHITDLEFTIEPPKS